LIHKGELQEMERKSQKSSFSGGGGSVEIVRFDGMVAIFDDDLDGNGGATVVTSEEFSDFEKGVRSGELSAVAILPNEGSGFSERDLVAWDLGLKAGEFALNASLATPSS
jgi:hypothetical protein